MTRRRILTAREQHELLSPWREAATWWREALIKEARYPQEWNADAPYGHLPSGRARNRPPSVLRDPDDPSAGIIDPSEIRYEKEKYNHAVSAFHPNGDHLGNYSWEPADYNSPAHIGIAQVDPKYQGQGVAGGIIDHIREHHEPDLAHSGFRGVGSLSYQGRAGALRDLGNTQEEHNDYFNTTPYNYGEKEPARFGRFGPITEAQRQAHAELMKHFEEDQQHPNFTGERSEHPRDSNMVDEYGDRHEYGYDSGGNYVGQETGIKDSDGYSEKGYNSEGYDRSGYNREGYDSDGNDEYGFSGETGVNWDGETRHGYTPGDGTPPEGTVPMSQMADHWAKHGLPTTEDHQRMMDSIADWSSPTMYAVRRTHQVSPDSGTHHVGNGDTLYSSLNRARQVAYHPDDPSQDKNIVSVDNLDPDWLHTDASGKTPEDFHYAPDSTGIPGPDVADTTSTEADFVHDPVRHQRILGDLGHGWSQSTEPPLSVNSGFEYTDPETGRTGRMYQQGNNGTWRTEHQPEFGRVTRNTYSNYSAAAEGIRQGTRPGYTLDQHALEVNNNYGASGGGKVEWEPHPNGQGLMAHTPHGDLHLTQDPDDGSWNWHVGPHGSQPGETSTRHSPYSGRLNSSAEQAIGVITRNPFHGGLGDELGAGWQPHPVTPGTYSLQLPSGNHALMRRTEGGRYESGIQRDNGRGQPSSSVRPTALRDFETLDEAHDFIRHHENRVPASTLGEGWQDWSRGPTAYPSYIHETHPSGSEAFLTWSPLRGGWRAMASDLNRDLHTFVHKTPQGAAAQANKFLDGLGKQ